MFTKDHQNVIVTISLAVDNALRRTLSSISTSNAKKYFDVVIKIGRVAPSSEIDRLYGYCRSLGLNVLVLNYADKGIYNAMNQALLVARNYFCGFCWFINAGDLCTVGIHAFSPELTEASPLSEDQSVLIGGVAIASQNDKMLKQYRYNGFPCLWFKPPLHSAVLFPSHFWHHTNYLENLEIAADVDYIYKSVKFKKNIKAVDDVISTFYLGGVSSKARTFRSAIRLCRQRSDINLKNIPPCFSLLVTLLDCLRILFRSVFPKRN